jgi:hypothetical protein
MKYLLTAGEAPYLLSAAVFGKWMAPANDENHALDSYRLQVSLMCIAAIILILFCALSGVGLHVAKGA